MIRKFAVVLLLAGSLVACNDVAVEAPEESERMVACYKGDKFVKLDDDCHDDGLTVGPRPTPKAKISTIKPAPRVTTKKRI